MKKIIYFLCLISFFSISCRKPEKVSEIPEIKFIGVSIKDTVNNFDNPTPIRRASLTFSLIDGNGDIGLNSYDTVSPYNIGSIYYNNIYIDLYTKVNGQMESMQMPFYFRTPYIQPQGIDKVLQCTIKVDMDFNFPVSWDSCEFVFYMYDRAQHKSNVVSSGYRKLAP